MHELSELALAVPSGQGRQTPFELKDFPAGQTHGTLGIVGGSETDPGAFGLQTATFPSAMVMKL